MYVKVYLRSDGIGYQSQGDNFNIVGCVCRRNPQPSDPRLEVLMDLGGNSWLCWCASKFETIPHDELWTVCRWNEWFQSKVQFHNLDFRGTPFEHRHGEYISRRRRWKFRPVDMGNIVALAEQERNMWGIYFATFIPFKRPNPQGYQGVWGNFDRPLTYRFPSITVRDTVDSGRHILVTVIT